MQEAEKALKTMGIWAAAILACNLLRVAEEAWIPLPHSFLSILYLPVFSIFLIRYYSSRIAKRNGVKTCLLGGAWLMLFLVFIREIKYRGLGEGIWFGRFLWYLYYLPIIVFPVLTFFSAVLVNERDYKSVLQKWKIICYASAFLILLVLTNDIHQQIFHFQADFLNWNTDYSYRWGFFLIWIWQYALYLASLIAMARRCRMTSSKNAVWVPAIPLVVGAVLLIIINLHGAICLHGTSMLNFPDTVILTVAFYWEACIQIGLIPTNENYSKLMNRLSLPVWITTEKGEVVYSSKLAGKLADEMNFISGDVYLDEDTLLHIRQISGGFGVWKEDISEIRETQEKLKIMGKNLEEEAVLIQLENERKEEQAHIEHQNALYDRIAVMTERQMEKIHVLAMEAVHSREKDKRCSNTALICLYGAYIKRISNLILLDNGENMPGSGELFLSVSESFHSLEKCGIICALGQQIDQPCKAERLVWAYYLFEQILEENLDSLLAVYAAFQMSDNLYLRMTLEGNVKSPSSRIKDDASFYGIPLFYEMEEEVLFVRILLKQGGDIQ